MLHLLCNKLLHIVFFGVISVKKHIIAILIIVLTVLVTITSTTAILRKRQKNEKRSEISRYI